MRCKLVISCFLINSVIGQKQTKNRNKTFLSQKGIAYCVLWGYFNFHYLNFSYLEPKNRSNTRAQKQKFWANYENENLVIVQHIIKSFVKSYLRKIGKKNG